MDPVVSGLWMKADLPNAFAKAAKDRSGILLHPSRSALLESISRATRHDPSFVKVKEHRPTTAGADIYGKDCVSHNPPWRFRL
jgi:hypothetical protein